MHCQQIHKPIYLSIVSYTMLNRLISSDDDWSMADDDDETLSLSECTVSDSGHFWRDRFPDEDIASMEREMELAIENYVSEHILSMKRPRFHEELVETVADELFSVWCAVGSVENTDYEPFYEWVSDLAETYFETGIVPRRQTISVKGIWPSADAGPYCPDELADKLRGLHAVPKIEQRSADWHEQRYNMLTASNAAKLFGTEAARNSLIYEKCKPYDTEAMDLRHAPTNQPLNDKLAMNWGVKYEPVSILLYELFYKEKVMSFGCIPHRQYPFIGASPDGIVERNGRMVEIKNIYNRTIDSIPKEAYWIQMQWQMETCDLDECDFVESRIKEFDGPESFYEMAEKMRAGDEMEKMMGVMVFLIPRVHIRMELNREEMDDEEDMDETVRDAIVEEQVVTVHGQYVTMPFDVSVDRDSIEGWLRDLRVLYPNHVLHETYYWILDEWSCVLVKRNRPWFDTALPMIQETWNTILKERESSDYMHRAPKKKVRSNSHEIVVNKEHGDNHYIRNMPALFNNVCLVKLDSAETARAESQEMTTSSTSEVRMMHLY